MGKRKILLRISVFTLIIALCLEMYPNDSAQLQDERQSAVHAVEATAIAEANALSSAKNAIAALEPAAPRHVSGNGSAKPDKVGQPAGDTAPSLPQQPAKHDEAAHKKEAKRIALTFDDGPDKTYTPLILDVLKKREIKATFFVVGTQVAKYGDVMKRISAEGHAIGNHTWDHADLTKRTAEQIAQEISRTDEAIRKALGTGTKLFRPPYGAANDKVKAALADADQQLIQWTVDTRDWAGTAPTEIVEKVKKQAKPGGIILMHCFGGKNGKLDNTIEALPLVIDYLKEEGYTFVTVPELTADKKPA